MNEYDGNSNEPSWFKFHRYWIEDSPVFANAEYLKIFVWLLSRARHKPGHVTLKSGQVVSLKKGECIVGRQATARALDMSESTFRNRLEKLAELGAITLKKDRSFTRVSIVFLLGCKHKKDKVRTTRGQPEDNLRTTRGQSEDTNKTNETDQMNETTGKGENEVTKVTSVPSPAKADSGPLANHGFTLSNGSLWKPTVAKVQEWQGTFPVMDLDAQLRLAGQWLKDNPAKRKTERGMHRFLFAWLERAQNSNKALPLFQPTQQPKRPDPYGNCPRYS
jgi:hypothetical protein